MLVFSCYSIFQLDSKRLAEEKGNEEKYFVSELSSKKLGPIYQIQLLLIIYFIVVSRTEMYKNIITLSNR